MKSIYIDKDKLLTMTLPNQFKKENIQNILIYHYVEELISDFTDYSNENFFDEDITLTELPFLLRIRFVDKSTQKDLVRLFKVSDGYASKILRKFEDKGYIKRKEDPQSRRRKIVELTDKGTEKTDEILNHINEWETQHAYKMSPDEMESLKNLLFKFLNWIEKKEVKNMPVVRITANPNISLENKRKMTEEVCKIVADAYDLPIEAITIIIDPIPVENIGSGGKLLVDKL